MAQSLKHTSLAQKIISWQKVHGRHHLPWQNTQDAYRVWLSEIMLQQTQVAAVIAYYTRFIEAFPTVKVLAEAPEDDVMALWAGLGYYSRARNLHKCAKKIMIEFGGVFPADQTQLQSLPGVGRSTAAAISSLAFERSAAIMDGNVKRVFCRYFGIEGYPGIRAIEQKLWLIAEAEKPETELIPYTQGLMDLGATICSRSSPKCLLCPLQHECIANAKGKQTALPTPKPKKDVPQRTAHFALVLRLQHETKKVLLIKRPPTGIWGGLWCLPQLDIAPNNFNHQLPGFVHVFTHFKMQAHVYLMKDDIANNSSFIADVPAQWVGFEELRTLGLPAPIFTYVLQLLESEKSSG